MVNPSTSPWVGKCLAYSWKGEGPRTSWADASLPKQANPQTDIAGPGIFSLRLPAQKCEIKYKQIKK